MVVFVYKCTLNLVSPAPLTRDCWPGECRVQVYCQLCLLRTGQAGPLARPVWPHACKHSKSPDWIRVRLGDTQVYSCTDKNAINDNVYCSLNGVH